MASRTLTWQSYLPNGAAYGFFYPKKCPSGCILAGLRHTHIECVFCHEVYACNLEVWQPITQQRISHHANMHMR